MTTTSGSVNINTPAPETTVQPGERFCFLVSGCPPRSAGVLPGSGDPGLPQRRLRLLAVSLETPGHLQTGPGGIRVRAPPEPLHLGHAAVGAVPEAPAGQLHRLPPAGPADPGLHGHERLAAVRAGAQGEPSRPSLGTKSAQVFLFELSFQREGNY